MAEAGKSISPLAVLSMPPKDAPGADSRTTYWENFDMATFKRRESAMYKAILPPDLFSDVVGKGVPYSEADEPAWTAEITAFFRHAVSSDDNLEAFLNKHSADNRSEWVPGIYSHDSCTSLRARLNHFANAFCRQKCHPLYTQIMRELRSMTPDKKIKHSSKFRFSGESLRLFEMEQRRKTQENRRVCYKLAGQIVRTFRHLHPEQSEPIIKELLTSKSLDLLTLKTALLRERDLHKHRLANREDGQILEFLIEHENLRKAIKRGLVEMQSDVVILNYGGDWLNPFWFWFAWHGPGYALLRKPCDKWSDLEQTLFAGTDQMSAKEWNEIVLKDIVQSWRTRLKSGLNHLPFSQMRNVTAITDYLNKECDEFLIRRLMWLLLTRQENYASWTLLDFNFPWPQ